MILKYDYISLLNSGHFGTANLCKDRETNEEVVIKFIPRKQGSTCEKEALHHKQLHHENIVHYFVTNSFECIVMEYVKGGDLFNELVQYGKIPEQKAKQYFIQLLHAVMYMHEQNMCHKDIKLENILLFNNTHIKLCDFGYTTNFHSDEVSLLVGTPAYLPPELIQKKRIYYPAKIDVWSCGVSLYVMLFGEYPFPDQDDIKMMLRNICRGRYEIPKDTYISKECRDILQSMLITDPHKRPNICNILCHPWLTKHNYNSVKYFPYDEDYYYLL